MLRLSLEKRLKNGGALVILDFYVDGERAGHCHGHGPGQNHEHAEVTRLQRYEREEDLGSRDEEDGV